MPLTTYSELKANIISHSHRNDVADKIDDFLKLAEDFMFANPDFPLQLRQMETRATASVSASSRFLALPDGFLTMRRLKLNLSQGDCDVRFVAPDQMIIHSTSGIPRFYTVSSQLEFDRTPDSAYTIEMQYTAIPTPLSASNTTNAILTNNPSAYLYGALTALFGWANDDVQEARYLAKFQGVIAGINKQYKQGRYGSAPVMRIEGATP